MAHPKGKVGTNRCYVELIDLHVLCLLGNKFVQQDDVKDFGTGREPSRRRERRDAMDAKVKCPCSVFTRNIH